MFRNSKHRQHLRDIILRFTGSILQPRKNIFILNAHFVAKQYPSYEMYCDFLQYLSQRGDLIRVENAVELIGDKTIVSDCLISFTYDDGFEECHSIIAPALEEFKINGAFFINSNFINGDLDYKEKFVNEIVMSPGKSPMDWKQIQELHKHGHIIGSHTLDHVNMNSTDIEFIEFQLIENKIQIEKQLNFSCEYFAFPFGQLKHINNETLNIAERYHKYIFSASNFRNYFSFNGRVINRRHIESWWPKSHINSFLAVKRSY